METYLPIDIFVITYNRANKLYSTLKQLLDSDSPVKNYPIHIIDNNSTDDTTSIVNTFLSQYSNLTYEKNQYNIGGNANIVKAFYKASKEYIWILADNDQFCWKSWSDVENGIKNAADAIIVSKYENPEKNLAQLFIQTTFLPGVIYKTENIDDTVMGNMQFNISNMFPHLALSAKLLNENKNIAIIKNAIVIPGDNRDETTGDYKYTRGYKDTNIHPLMKNMNWLTGYANSLHLIKDKNLRNYIANNNMFYYCPLTSANIFYYNEKESEGSLYNLLSIFCVLNMWNKLRFIINFILYHTLYRIIYIYSSYNAGNENYYTKIYKMRLLHFIKMNLFRISITR